MQALLQSLQADLQHHRDKNADVMKLSEQKDSDVSETSILSQFSLCMRSDAWKLSEQIENLSRDLQRVKDELAEAQKSVEKEELESLVATLTAERDQLKIDLQENVEMVSLSVLPKQP